MILLCVIQYAHNLPTKALKTQKKTLIKSALYIVTVMAERLGFEPRQLSP